MTVDAVLLVFEYGCAQVHEDRDQSTVKNGPYELFSGVLLPLCVLRLREVRVRYGEQLWSSLPHANLFKFAPMWRKRI